MIGIKRWFPSVIVIACFVTLYGVTPMDRSAVLCLVVLGLALVAWTVRSGQLLSGQPEPRVVSRTVGGLIQGLLLFQAALASTVSWDGLAVAMVLVLTWPAFSLLANVFNSS